MCQILLYRKVTQLCIYIIFHIIFHYGLSHDIEYSSLCYSRTLLFIHSVYCYTSLHQQIPNSQSNSLLLHTLATISLFCVPDFVSVS